MSKFKSAFKSPSELSRRQYLKLFGAAVLSPALLPLAASSAEAKPILRKAIPSTGETLPVIGLGTSRVFDVSTADERAGPREVMQQLASVPNSMVDTSPMYGNAEAVVGELGSELGVRPSLFYATKVWTEGKQTGIEQMQRSMRLMASSKLDLIQIHNLLDWRTHLQTLREMQQQGTVRYIGITHYHAGSHAEVVRLLQQESLNFVQINYSIAEPEAAERVLPVAADRGVAVIINRPFARGHMFSASKGKPLPAWAAEIDCQSWAQVFLKYVVSHPAVTVAIPGTSKLKHMIDNQQAGMGRMPDAAMREKIRQSVVAML